VRPRPSRRDVLRFSGGAGLAAILAACTGRISGSGKRASASGSASSTASSSRPTPPSYAALSSQLSSPLIRSGNPAYAGAARLYNPRFDASAHPAAIAECASTDDVLACVRFAAAGGAPLAIRSGGHSYGGWSSGSGLVADLTPMSTVTIDATSGTARIGAGARLIDVYSALGAKGVALAAGSCPTVGITGLAQAGGIGVLSRAWGLTCDSIRSVQIVTADATLREVDKNHDPDLFWALRGGGGGSFGVVTALTMAVRPAPQVQTFFYSWDISRGSAVLAAWQAWIGTTDRQLWSTCKLLNDPPKNSAVATVSGTWIGAASALTGQLAPLLAAIGVGPSVTSKTSMDYTHAMLLEAGCSGQTASQCKVAALTPAKRQPFAATSAILSAALPPAGIAAAVAQAQAASSVPGMFEGGVSFDSLGGAIADVAPGDSAFVHRQALASVQFTATWASMTASPDPKPFDTYVRAGRSALATWTGTGAYVGYCDPSIVDYGPAYWGANYARLQTVKKQYDPADLFTFPQSVRA
jgi:FAD/FMN-containing dehydrogenase